MTLATDAAYPQSGQPEPQPGPLAAFVALADALGDGLVEVDDRGYAHPLNPTAAELLPLLGGAAGEALPAEIAALLANSAASGRAEVRDFTGVGPAARHLRVATLCNGPVRLLAVRDSTEERLLQERLLQSEKMASVGQLVSGVAHELNNPLTGVMGFAQLLLSRDLDETSLSQVRTIYGEAERAAKIVQNLLSFARRRKPAKEMADINALLAQVLELRSYDFGIRNIALDMELDPRMPRCWVDPDQVQQVFFNIVKNAEQAMIEARGGGRLIVRTQSTEAGVRVTIADEGPGIAPEVARRIFDPFFTTKDAGQGTGLGLTISYGIVEEHGGRIYAENRPEGGAAFTVELPVGRPPQPAASEDAGPAGAPPVAGPVVAKPSYRVLVVDDEESIRLLLRDILEMDGHRVELAGSGIEAWQHLDAGDLDIIVTDMKMPGMDGATFYKELRRRDPDLARRLIFITGDTVSSDTRSFLQQVQNPVLSKPFKIGPLRDAMEEVMASRPA
jgi:two-component system NtrC family sensor kinase